MATKPKSIEIRSYPVGFGDCFLLSFLYAANDRRDVLIDFGTTQLPRGKVKPSEHMPRVAKDIQSVCGGKLTAVVATHRHEDHISGFATEGESGGSGKTIADCNPKLVLQPWTEDPAAARNAKQATKSLYARSPKGFIQSLAAMNALAGHIESLVENRVVSLSAATERQIRFLAIDNIPNQSAVQNLASMGARKGARAVYAHHGSDAGFGRLLPGVKVSVLGPPDLTQTEKIRSMTDTDPDEFWQLLGLAARPGAVAAMKSGRRGPRAPAEANWFIERLESLSGRQLLEIVRVLDKQMNNTSLILLFEVGGKKLLFPGDAQLENWSWALSDSPDAAKTRALLADVDVYKVGHHGSRNATPRKLLWDGFSKRGKAKGRLVSLLSTLPGKHGHANSNTEVPRKTLLDALKTETVLHNTDDVPWDKSKPFPGPVVIPV